MQFILSVIDDGQADLANSSASATEAEAAAIDVFNDRLQNEGHWIFAGGMELPADSAVVDNRGTSAVLTDGPLVDGPSFIAGFWIIEAADRAEALALSTEGSKACNRRVEVRAFQ